MLMHWPCLHSPLSCSIGAPGVLWPSWPVRGIMGLSDARVKRGTYSWLPNRVQMSYSACQIGQIISYGFQSWVGQKKATKGLLLTGERRPQGKCCSVSKRTDRPGRLAAKRSRARRDVPPYPRGQIDQGPVHCCGKHSSLPRRAPGNPEGFAFQDPRSGEEVERKLWVTRKGATSAREGQLGIIPGSMGVSPGLSVHALHAVLIRRWQVAWCGARIVWYNCIL
jgi:tRNA-splicing ligase RtcB